MVYRIFGVLIAIMLLSASWQAYRENRAFRLFGQTAYVEPVDHYNETTTTYKSKSTGETRSQYTSTSVDAYFMTADNRRVKIERAMPSSIVNALIRREKVQITYVSNDPQLVRFDDTEARPGIALLAGILVLYLSLRSWQLTE